jgi:hypothetical protein
VSTQSVNEPFGAAGGCAALREHIARRLREARRGRRACIGGDMPYAFGRCSGMIAELVRLAKSPLARKTVPMK